MAEWVTVWMAALARPEVLRWLSLTAAGIVGALVSTALDAKAIALPRLRCGRLELGWLGPLLASIVAAHFVDHDFQTALLGALCGVSAMRHIRTRVEAAFDDEVQHLQNRGEGDDEHR